MTPLTFDILASLIILGLVTMIVSRPVHWVLVGWGLVSFMLAILFFLLSSPFVAAVQLLLTACLGCSFALAIKRSPKTKTRSISASSILTMILALIFCLALALMISVRLWSLAHTQFPEGNQGPKIALALEQLFTGQNPILVFGTALLVLSSLVSLVTLTRKEKA